MDLDCHSHHLYPVVSVNICERLSLRCIINRGPFISTLVVSDSLRREKSSTRPFRFRLGHPYVFYLSYTTWSSTTHDDATISLSRLFRFSAVLRMALFFNAKVFSLPASTLDFHALHFMGLLYGSFLAWCSGSLVILFSPLFSFHSVFLFFFLQRFSLPLSVWPIGRTWRKDAKMRLCEDAKILIHDCPRHCDVVPNETRHDERIYTLFSL